MSNTGTAKYHLLAAQLRRGVAEGKWEPGGKLPSRRQLQQDFEASSITVQRAFDALTEEGFVVPEGPRGTFVAERPPSHYRYGLVFDRHPDGSGWSRFFESIKTQAQAIGSNRPCSFRMYFGAGGHPDQESTQSLFDDIRQNRLAGVILSRNIPGSSEWPIWDETDLPGIVIQSSPTHPRFPAIYPRLASFMETTFDFLVERGRRQIALIGPLGKPEDSPGLAKTLQKRNLNIPPYHRIHLTNAVRDVARNCAHLLMKSAPVPNALIVSDDNLLDPVAAGVLAAGARVPEELTIVSLANFPVDEQPLVPVTRIGFDIHRLIELCLESMGRQRKGQNEKSRLIGLEAQIQQSSALQGEPIQERTFLQGDAK
ncbi:MAG: GntR family transcriptional regulator [Candidatus Brocadiia bacterium]